MAKTNWQDPRTGEIISPHISGLQEAVGKIEESIGMNTISETNIPLEEVFISADDRCRIYQAPEGKRNWLLSPTPLIKKNGVIITDDFEIDYGGGAIIFTTPILESDILTADVTYTKRIDGKQLSTNDFTNEERTKLDSIEKDADKTTKENIATALGYTPVKSINNALPDENGDVSVTIDSDIEIINNLDETEIGKALDATQGKILNGKINNLFSKGNLGSVDFNMLTGEGYLGIALGTSENNAPTNGSYYYIVNLKYNRGGGDNDNIKQIAWGYSDNVLFTRHRYNNNWTSWTEQISSLGGNFTGEVKHGRNLVTQPKLKDYSEINTILFPESNTVIDLSKGNVFELIPDKGVTLSITNSSTTSPTNCHSFTLIITMQSPVHPITFPSSIKWVGDNPPDLTKPNREYYLTFVGRSGMSKWTGMFGGDTVVG